MMNDASVANFFYNGFHYRTYQGRLYAVCEKSMQYIYNLIDNFDSFINFLDSAGPERAKPKLEKDGNEYILSYSWKTYYDTNEIQYNLTFRFAKDLSCKEIEMVQDDITSIYTFEYGNKKEYFDILRDIQQEETVKIDIKNLSEDKHSFGPCKVPTDMYIWIDNIAQCEIYLDSACTEPYAVSVGPASWISEEKITCDQTFYVIETYERNEN